MLNTELEQRINHYLNAGSFNDYAPNGLQVEGRAEVQKIITGVTACQALLDEAVRLQADAVLVHHGYFWKSEPAIIRGMKRQRLKTLLTHDINLFAWHLPLDGHPELGNNALLGRMLAITHRGEIAPLLSWGELQTPLSGRAMAERLAQTLDRHPLHCSNNAPELIRRVAWCTGGGQGLIDEAITFGVDAYITGEVSEKTIHSAREGGVHFYAAGHHATERAGVSALGEWLTCEYGFDVTFIDIDNPA